uniref:Uncharacterized protein n=1 Tax=Streptomyces sp. NBC_00049 TaxID=2903617 RepID=A0AAU2K058_9ACTN
MKSRVLSTAPLLASLLAAGLWMSPPAAAADPDGCVRTAQPTGGDLILCAQGLRTGEVLEGTSGNDTIIMASSPVGVLASVYGRVNGNGGDDTILAGGVLFPGGQI